MDATAIALAITVLENLPALITASEEVIALISSTVTSLRQMQAEKRDPTDAEWAAVHSVIDILLTRIEA
jgi:hypothetical protein